MGKVRHSNSCLPKYTANDAELDVLVDACLIYVTTTNATFTVVGVWCREEGVWKKM